MKRKIFTLILALITAFSFAACSAGDVSVAFDDGNLPWYTGGGYEKVVYTVKKYSRTQVNKATVDAELVAEGKIIQTLETTISGENRTMTLTSEGRLSYLDTDAANSTDERGLAVVNRGMTDRYTSVVTFNQALSPLTSTKTMTCDKRPEDSVQPYSYNWTADYTQNTMTVQRGDEQAQTYAMAGGTKYDDQQINYLVRAMSGVAKSGSGTFYLVNPYDSLVAEGYRRHTMRLSCAADATPIALSDYFTQNAFIISDKEGALSVDSENKYNINCVEATVSINSENSGPAIKMFFADPDYTFARANTSSVTTRKLLIRTVTTEYHVAQAAEAFRVVTDLDKYSTTRGEITDTVD